MKTIILEANGTTLTVLSSENLVSGSNRNILKVKFSEDWEDYDKTALFTLYDISGGSILYKDNYESIFDNPYSELPNPLIPNNGEYICIIPSQFTSEPGTLSINIVGTRPIIDPEPEKACTNEAIINVEKGASVSDGELGQPSEGLYAQVLALANEAADVSGTANANAKYAYNAAKEVLDAKNNGELDGKDGKDGKDGADGITPHIGENGNWFIGDTDTGVKADVSEDIGVIDKSILPNLPKDVNGKIIEAASKTDIVALKNEVETFPKIGKVFHDTINDKEFIKSSIAYVGGITSTKNYIAVYDNRTEDGTATFGDAPCKSGILFHYQTMSNVIIQTLYGNDSRVYQRIFFTDMGTFGAWSDTWETVETLEEEVSAIAEALPTEKNGDYKEVAAKEDVDNLDNKLMANILKGSASGTIVSMKDVSPIEHEMGVKVRGKNLVDLTNVYRSTYVDYRVEDNKLIIKKTNTKENQFSNIFFYLGKCKDFANKKLTIRATNESTTPFTIHLSRFYSNGERVDYVKFGSLSENKTTTYTATVPDNDLDDVMCLRLVCPNTTVTDEEYTFSNIQIEEGTVATAYAPYIPDITQAKILKQGKNLLDLSKPYILANGTYTETNGTVEIVRTHESRAPNVYIRVGKATDFAGETFTFSFTYAETNGTGEGTSGIDYYMGTHANGTFTRIAASSTRAVETRIHISGTVPTDVEGEFVIRFNCSIIAAVNEYVKLKDIQVEVGTATDYEPYIAPTEYDITANGTVPGVKSIHPSTTLYSDTSGVVIDVDYNRDINIAFKNLEDKITALSAAMI